MTRVVTSFVLSLGLLAGPVTAVAQTTEEIEGGSDSELVSEMESPPEEANRLPTRVAQYPLENDPYEGPPEFSGRQPQVGVDFDFNSLSPEERGEFDLNSEETGWIRWDETRLNANILHDGPSGLGITDLVITGITKTPLTGYAINPQFGAHFFSGSSINAVPHSTYDVSVEFTGAVPLSDNVYLLAGISPGLFSDFEGGLGDSFRIPSRFLAYYKYSETFSVGAGLLYLDRPDVNYLPLVGLSYHPHDEFKMDLWFPRPKVSWRYQNTHDFERWIYVVGEFGGGAWTVRMPGGGHDQFAYRDYRAMVGLEQTTEEGIGWFVEAGYIFGREASFDRADREYELDSTAGLQFGLRF